VIIVMTTLGTAGASSGEEGTYLYEKMTPARLREAVSDCPVAYVPAGINEWHGEQSACGLDALKAETIARMAARLMGGVCFPTHWLGPPGSTPFDPEKYPRGTVTVGRDVYMKGAAQLIPQLQSMGFKVVRRRL
jgi:creatinine amidohydrolase/Fe(II)-dependent formamide hydrolase-like protein